MTGRVRVSALRHPYRAWWLWRHRAERKSGLIAVPPWASKAFPPGMTITMVLDGPDNEEQS